MEKTNKKFEVILHPKDILDFELNDILGGMSDCICNAGSCYQNYPCTCNDGSCFQNGGEVKPCPPGYIYDPSTGGCKPIE